MERYRLEVGHQHEVKPGNIVGAIANEAGLDARNIGHIDIHTEYSLVDLPIGMPKDVLQDLRKARVCGHRLDISRLGKTDTKKTGVIKKKAVKKRKGTQKPAKRKKTRKKTGI